MLVPYFKEGLERGEACVWIVADLTIQEATDAQPQPFPTCASIWPKDR